MDVFFSFVESLRIDKLENQFSCGHLLGIENTHHLSHLVEVTVICTMLIKHTGLLMVNFLEIIFIFHNVISNKYYN